MLLRSSEEDLCLTCHGTLGTGATTNVEDGVQYTAVNNGTYSGDTGPVLGALRGGGFVHARIDSSNAARVLKCGDKTTSCYIGQWAKVRALATGAPVTSAHLNLAENGLDLPQVAWGNGAPNTGPGPAVILGCATCHNPHGNGKYRILNPIPAPDVSSGTFTAVASPGSSVTDAALPGTGAGPRNYTIIQTPGGTGTLLASQAATARGSAGATSGDYWHVRVPWNPSSGLGTADAPNGISASFNDQIRGWCKACHVQYHSEYAYDPNPSGDELYKYRHVTTGRLACTTCHVAHGSNAQMPGTGSLTDPNYSMNFPYPGGTIISASSRLLKVDNRGTCQLCHDPTHTVTPGTYTGPDPTPGVP